jgi:hypothetical protein
LTHQVVIQKEQFNAVHVVFYRGVHAIIHVHLSEDKSLILISLSFNVTHFSPL